VTVLDDGQARAANVNGRTTRETYLAAKMRGVLWRQAPQA